MKQVSRRVCSHTEPPPPNGNGRKFDICASCVVHPNKRKASRIGNLSGHYDPFTMTAMNASGVPYKSTELKLSDDPLTKRFQIAMMKKFQPMFDKVHQDYYRDVGQPKLRPNRLAMRRSRRHRRMYERVA